MQPKDEGRRMETKARRETIGVTTKRSFHVALTALAERRGLAKAELARDLLQNGLERFECAMETKNPSSLLRTYELAAKSYGGDSEQWVLRLDRPLAKLVRMTAKEFEKSTSQIASFLLAESLQHEGIQPSSPGESALIYGDKISSDKYAPRPHNEDPAALPNTSGELDSALLIVNSWLPPKRSRALAKDSGLGEHRDLICQVLQGETIAPLVVIDSISNHVHVPVDLLIASFKSNFQNRTVPMFKSTQKKPQLASKPRSWSEAVKALNLSTEEERALLALEH